MSRIQSTRTRAGHEQPARTVEVRTIEVISTYLFHGYFEQARKTFIQNGIFLSYRTKELLTSYLDVHWSQLDWRNQPEVVGGGLSYLYAKYIKTKEDKEVYAAACLENMLEDDKRTHLAF